MPLDWSILQSTGPVDVAGNFARGFQMGQVIVDKYHERNALAALAQHPNDPQALSMLYQVNPVLGSHFEQLNEARVKAQRETEDRGRAVALGELYTKDPQGAREEAIAAGDFDLAKTFSELDKTKQAQAADFWSKAGPIAFKLKQETDPTKRQALWQQARPILQSEGVDQAQLDKFDPTNDAQLDAALTMAQKMSDIISQNKPTAFNVDAGAARYEQDPVTGQIRMVIAPNPDNKTVGSPVAAAHPPQAAIDYLKAHPDLAPHFDEKYGSGAAASVLGGQSAPPTGGFSMRNNPGALRVPGSMRFQSFSSPQEGIAAQQALLSRYMGRGLNNVSSIVETYAPRRSRGGDNSDASVNNYIAYVSRRIGVDPNSPIPPALLPQLSQAMREFETGQMAY
jgi:hypothetical protein